MEHLGSTKALLLLLFFWLARWHIDLRHRIRLSEIPLQLLNEIGIVDATVGILRRPVEARNQVLGMKVLLGPSICVSLFSLGQVDARALNIIEVDTDGCHLSTCLFVLRRREIWQCLIHLVRASEKILISIAELPSPLS